MSETIAYMEDYLDRFYQMKDIFLEHRVTKRTRTNIDEYGRELRHHRAQMSERVAPSKRHRNMDADREEEIALRMVMI